MESYLAGGCRAECVVSRRGTGTRPAEVDTCILRRGAKRRSLTEVLWSRICPVAAGQGARLPAGEPGPVPPRWTPAFSVSAKNAGRHGSPWSRICPAPAGHRACFPAGEHASDPPRWTRAFPGTALPTLVNEVTSVVPMKSRLLRFAGFRGPFPGRTTGGRTADVATCISEHGRLAGCPEIFGNSIFRTFFVQRGEFKTTQDSATSHDG